MNLVPETSAGSSGDACGNSEAERVFSNRATREQMKESQDASAECETELPKQMLGNVNRGILLDA
jgi:hypothetical protein